MTSIWIKLRWLRKPLSRAELSRSLRLIADEVDRGETDGLIDVGHFKINGWREE